MTQHKLSKSELKRFMDKVEKTESCWLWKAHVKCPQKPYGMFWLKGKLCGAHRVIYQHYNGKINSKKIYVCHKCDNHRCVNPRHLFLGDNTINYWDSRKKGRAVLGERYPQAKLSYSKAEAIRRKYKNGISSTILGKEYGVHPVNILLVVKNKRWVLPNKAKGAANV